MLILGASGRTGRLLVERALGHGHRVTALVRSGSAFLIEHPNLRVVTGDVLRPDTLPDALAGCDLVISLVAPRPRKSGDVYTEGMRNLANAAIAAGVSRLIAVSAEGAGVNSSALPLGYRFVRRIPVVSRLYPAIALMCVPPYSPTARQQARTESSRDPSSPVVSASRARILRRSCLMWLRTDDSYAGLWRLRTSALREHGR